MEKTAQLVENIHMSASILTISSLKIVQKLKHERGKVVLVDERTKKSQGRNRRTVN